MVQLDRLRGSWLAVLCTPALHYIMMRRRRGRETEDEKGEGILYCLYAGVAPTMITNQCYFSQVQAGEGIQNKPWRNQRLFASPEEEMEGRSEQVGSLKLCPPGNVCTCVSESMCSQCVCVCRKLELSRSWQGFIQGRPWNSPPLPPQPVLKLSIVIIVVPSILAV